MLRGEIWWVDFDGRDSEIQKERPAVIVSNDFANRSLDRLQVVPLSSQVKKVFPSEALVWAAGKRAKAMADQITTVDKKWVSNRFGSLSEPDLRRVELAIRIQLGLEST